MTKIYVPITNEEYNRLAQLAQRECRSPRDQARVILRAALLGGKDQPNKTPTPAGEKQAAGVATGVAA